MDFGLPILDCLQTASERFTGWVAFSGIGVGQHTVMLLLGKEKRGCVLVSLATAIYSQSQVEGADTVRPDAISLRSNVRNTGWEWEILGLDSSCRSL